MHLIPDEASVRKWLHEHPEAARSILDERNTQPKGAALPDKRKPQDAAFHSDDKLASPKKWKHEESDPSVLFFEVTRIAQSNLDLETVLPSVLGISARATNAEKCSIFLFDRDSNELLADVWESTNHGSTSGPILKSSTCIHQSVDGFIDQDNQESRNDLMQCDKRKIQLVCGRGITGTVAATQKGLNIEDVAKGKSLSCNQRQNSNRWTRSSLSSRLRFKERI